MEFSDMKTIRKFCASLVSSPDWREVVRNIADDNDDFYVDNVRFINSDVIDDVQANEMKADWYRLGCFNAQAIADATGWPVALIEAAQKGEAYEEIGNAMSDDQVRALQEIYSSADGYGHHFNSYDFSEEELRVNDNLFYVFDNR